MVLVMTRTAVAGTQVLNGGYMMQDRLEDTDVTALEPFRRASAALSVWFNRPKLYAPPDSDIVLKARKELNNRNSAKRRTVPADKKKTVAGSNVDIHRRRVDTEVKVCPRQEIARIVAGGQHCVRQMSFEQHGDVLQ